MYLCSKAAMLGFEAISKSKSRRDVDIRAKLSKSNASLEEHSPPSGWQKLSAKIWRANK